MSHFATSLSPALQSILDAQIHGHSRTANGPLTCPPFATALSEIESGSKTSHWIWYVFPSFSPVRSNVGNHARHFLIPTFAELVGLVTHPVLSVNLEHFTTMATNQLQQGTPPSVLFGKMHRYDVPKFIEGCICYAAACLVAANTLSFDVYVQALHAIKHANNESKQRFRTSIEHTTRSLLQLKDEQVTLAVHVVQQKLLAKANTGEQKKKDTTSTTKDTRESQEHDHHDHHHHQQRQKIRFHPLERHYTSLGFVVVIVPNLDQHKNNYNQLLGQPTDQRVLKNWTELRSAIDGQNNGKNGRLVLLEKGSTIPLLIFLAGDAHHHHSNKDDKKTQPATQESTSASSSASSSASPSASASASAALTALSSGTTRLKSWAAHPAPPLMHTGYTKPMINSFAFAYKSDAQHNFTSGCTSFTSGASSSSNKTNCTASSTNACAGLCTAHRLPLIRERSTLKNNRSIVNEFQPIITWLNNSLTTYAPPATVQSMETLVQRCSSRWVVAPNTLFTTLGVHFNFSQHYHLDQVDVDTALAAVVYHVDNPKDEVGGELMLPEVDLYLQPQHGDQVFWRTTRLIHGVGQFSVNTSLQRTSWVMFQTTDCLLGCVECSD